MTCRNFFTLSRTILPSCRLHISKCYSSQQEVRSKLIQEAVKESMQDERGTSISSKQTTRPKTVEGSIKTQRQEIIKDPNLLQAKMKTEVISKVNNLVETDTQGKLFCVFYICGKQFKVSVDDIVVVQGYWAPNVGDKIRLEKIMLVGSKDFTLIGRPVLPLDQVAVYATVIEKTTSQLVTWFIYIKRKNCRKTHLDKYPQTYIRINSIDIIGRVNELRDTDGFEKRLF